MRYWFTSDYHLGHANIIKYCKRPFKDLEHMNTSIINNHNSRVSPEDTVFFAGDFCFRNSPGGKDGEGTSLKATDYLQKLNGNFVFIKGNHDRNNSLKTIIDRVIINYGGKRVPIVHNPTHAYPQSEINFVGHVHEKWLIKRLNEKSIMYNVGIDVNGFKPVSFEEIMKNIRKWLKNEKKNI